MTLEKFKMMRQRKSINFKTRRGNRCGREISKKMPPGQIIDIPYLKTLGKNKFALIAYCPKVVTDPHSCPTVDIDQVTNFVPGYLARTNGCLWKVYEEEDYVVNKFNWDEGKHTLLDLFGTSIQHP